MELLYSKLGTDLGSPVLVLLALSRQHVNFVMFRLDEDGAWKVKRSVVLNLNSILEGDELAIWASLIRAYTPITFYSSFLMSSTGSATVSSATTSKLDPSSGHLLNVTSFWCRH